MKWLIILILMGFLSYLFFSSPISFLQFNDKKFSGKVISVQGTVLGRSAEDRTFKNLTINSPITQSFKIKTGFKSSTLVEFGETFKILAETSVELLNIGKRFEVHLISGEIERSKVTQKTDFLINNKKINIKKISYQLDTNKNNKLLNTNDESKYNKGTLNTKLQHSLKKTFKLHQRFLEKCFIKHYERSSGKTQSGTILLDFNIDKKGHLNSLKIKQSDYKDDSFHQCILDVISRIQMNRQSSEVFNVEFPIEVSLPN
jgi:hypothetical protein